MMTVREGGRSVIKDTGARLSALGSQWKNRKGPLDKQNAEAPSTAPPPLRCIGHKGLSPLCMFFTSFSKRLLKKPRPDCLGSGLVSPAKMPGGRVGGKGALDDRGEQGSQLVRPRARKLPSTQGG